MRQDYINNIELYSIQLKRVERSIRHVMNNKRWTNMATLQELWATRERLERVIADLVRLRMEALNEA